MNGRPSPVRGFDAAEFETRTVVAQGMMDRLALSAMLLSTEAEVRYYSGFHTPFWQSPTRPWFLLIPLPGQTDRGHSRDWGCWHGRHLGRGCPHLAGPAAG